MVKVFIDRIKILQLFSVLTWQQFSVGLMCVLKHLEDL